MLGGLRGLGGSFTAVPTCPKAAALALGLAVAAFGARAGAKDVGRLGGAPVRVDVTETSILKFHFDNRNDSSASDVETRIDDNYGEWLNRFNVSASWKAWQAGLRFDTATYFHPSCAAGRSVLTQNCPDADSFETPSLRQSAENKLAYRYRDQYLVSPGLPSKMYLTYATPDLEVTAGDAYVSFGRGFVLTMRKIDELAVDTSLQGGKVIARIAPLSLTAVAGLSNPVRIDEATGVTLRDAAPTERLAAREVWARDLIVGARAEARIARATLGVHAADVRRRNDLHFSGDPAVDEREVQSGGVSFAVPRVSEGLPLDVYTEVALQHRLPFQGDTVSGATESRGYAAYSALSLKTGIVTTALEAKHYRSFYPVRINADPAKFGAFKAVQYNAPPTVELVTQDSLFDNSCTTGGRLRVDVTPVKGLRTFASGAFFENWGEQVTNVCGIGPGLGLTSSGAGTPRNDIVDGYIGVELRSQSDSSYAQILGGVRRDTVASSGDSYYREGWVQFDFVKQLDAYYSLELQGWHRNRFEAAGGVTISEQWREGEDYLGVKYTSKRSIFVGHEYTTRPSQVKPDAFLANHTAQHFLNLGAQFKFDDAVTLRLFVGQQRGALKCVSGVCRVFPAFEGAKAEVVVRY